MFNPTVKEFMKEKEDLTVIGLFWAGYWRLLLCVTGGYMAFLIIIFFISFMVAAM